MPFFSAARLAAFVGQDCVLCASAGRELVCGACARTLPRAGEGPVVAAFAYAYPLDRLVRRFKFGGDLALGRWLGEALALAAAREARPDVVVVPPSTRRRLSERGFNPALEIARTASRSLGVGCAHDVLVRTRETLPQPGLTRRERRRNLEGAFACSRALTGLDVVVVDDVMTTGATIDAACAVLRRAGAARVRAWVAARTPPPNPS